MRIGNLLNDNLYYVIEKSVAFFFEGTQFSETPLYKLQNVSEICSARFSASREQIHVHAKIRVPKEDKIVPKFFTITLKCKRHIEIDCEGMECIVAKVYQGFWHVFFPEHQNMSIFHESDHFKVVRFIDIDYYTSGCYASAMANNTPHLFLFA